MVYGLNGSKGKMTKKLTKRSFSCWTGAYAAGDQGYSKRTLPVTRPIIEHVVQEAIAGGVTEIISDEVKEAIENHFDVTRT